MGRVCFGSLTMVDQISKKISEHQTCHNSHVNGVAIALVVVKLVVFSWLPSYCNINLEFFLPSHQHWWDSSRGLKKTNVTLMIITSTSLNLMLLRSIPLSTMALRQLPQPIFISHLANGLKFIFKDLLTIFFGVVKALLSPPTRKL
jgi:hypothetical protein